MNDPEDELLVRLKKSKILLAFTFIFLVGTLAIILNLGEQRHWFRLPGILSTIPWLAIGESCITAVLVGLVYERFVRRESENHLERTLKLTLKSREDLMVARIASAIALTDESLYRLNAGELDAAFKRMLSVKLGDDTLAEEVINGIVPQTVGSVERYTDFRCRVRLLPDYGNPDHGIRYMTARVTVSYHRVLRRGFMWFGLCSDATKVYARLDNSISWEVLWSPGRMIHYQMDDPRIFEIEYVQIDDVALDVTRIPDGKLTDDLVKVGYEAAADVLTDMIGREVEVEYCYTAKIPKLGHVLAFPITQVCKGVSFEFDLGDVGIDRATLWPFFVTGSPPKILVNEVGGRKVLSARTTRWVLAGGGISLVWRLAGESCEGFLEKNQPSSKKAPSNPQSGSS